MLGDRRAQGVSRPLKRIARRSARGFALSAVPHWMRSHRGFFHLNSPFLVFLIFVLGCPWGNWKHSGFSYSFCSLRFPGRWNADMPLSGLSPWPYVVLLLELLTSFWILFLFYQGRGSNHGQCHTLRGGTLGPSCLGLSFYRGRALGSERKATRLRLQGFRPEQNRNQELGLAAQEGRGAFALEEGWAWWVWGRVLLCAYYWAAHVWKNLAEVTSIYMCVLNTRLGEKELSLVVMPSDSNLSLGNETEMITLTRGLWLLFSYFKIRCIWGGEV